MIKTTTLLLLTARLLRSNRRTSIAMAATQVIVHANQLAQRAAKNWRSRVPALLVCSRAALGPLIITLSVFEMPGWILAACILLALVTDVYDGVLARAWQLDTITLRRWD